MAVAQEDTKTDNNEGKTDISDENSVTPAGNVPPEQAAPETAGADAEPAAATGQETGDVDLDALRQEIENLKQQLADNTDRMLRTQAEMDNLRKRTVRDVENAHKFALDSFVRELLPVIDSMELGISASDNGGGDIASFREGMDLTLKKFLDTLEKFGVSVVAPQGEKFNPEKHEAVSVQETDTVKSGMVVTVMQKGYELNGRLVRPAMVIVAK